MPKTGSNTSDSISSSCSSLLCSKAPCILLKGLEQPERHLAFMDPGSLLPCQLPNDLLRVARALERAFCPAIP